MRGFGWFPGNRITNHLFWWVTQLVEYSSVKGTVPGSNPGPSAKFGDTFGMKYWIELRGVITRDVIWRIVEAATESDAVQIAAQKYPNYKIHKVEPSICD